MSLHSLNAHLSSPHRESLNPGVSTIVSLSLTPRSSISMYFFSISTVFVIRSAMLTAIDITKLKLSKMTNPILCGPLQVSYYNI